jgi:hypothetical protein
LSQKGFPFSRYRLFSAITLAFSYFPSFVIVILSLVPEELHHYVYTIDGKMNEDRDGGNDLE